MAGPDDLSLAVMTHPARGDRAARLVEALRPLDVTVVPDPRPGDPPGTLRTSREAWRAAADGAAYHLVLQDDAVPCRDFGTHLADLLSQDPTGPVALHALWNTRNGAAIRWGAARGARLITAVPEFVPCVGLLMPRKAAEGYVAFTERWPDPATPDDVVMRRYFEAERLRLLLTVPSLVEHGQSRSLMGNDHGVYQAACFATPPSTGWFRRSDLLIDDFRLLPVVRQGRLWLCSPASPDAHVPWLTEPWEAASHQLVRGDELREEFDAFLDRTDRSTVDTWHRLVGTDVPRTAWTAARLLRGSRHTGVTDLEPPTSHLVLKALRTVLTGGFLRIPGPSPIQRAVLGNLERLLPLVIDGYGPPGPPAGSERRYRTSGSGP
ncbi:hypothetical protein [Streptomyces sp. NPDC088719]|uniref:hypothetical protein n=1 Tax=Streptomyces sp. NPDC088719 TaxID=3365872 RepID=UPI0037F30EED